MLEGKSYFQFMSQEWDSRCPDILFFQQLGADSGGAVISCVTFMRGKFLPMPPVNSRDPAILKSRTCQAEGKPAVGVSQLHVRAPRVSVGEWLGPLAQLHSCWRWQTWWDKVFLRCFSSAKFTLQKGLGLLSVSVWQDAGNWKQLKKKVIEERQELWVDFSVPLSSFLFFPLLHGQDWKTMKNKSTSPELSDVELWSKYPKEVIFSVSLT